MQIHVAKNGQQTGPFEEAQVREKLASGEFADTDLAWHADLAGWQPLSTLFPSAAPEPSMAPPAPSASPVAAVPVFQRADPTPAPYAPAPTTYQTPNAGGYTPLPVAGAPGQLPPPQFYNPAGLADPNLAGLGARFLGAFIDGLLLILCMAPGYALLIVGATSKDADGNLTSPGMAVVGTIGYLLGALVYLAIQAFLLSRSGQSVGKKIAGTRVVRVDGAPAGFVGAFLMRSVVAYLPNLIPLIGVIYAIVDICFVFRADHRCIHDLIAGTKVVRA